LGSYDHGRELKKKGTPPMGHAQNEERQLQNAIDQSNLRRANELSIAEKLKLGADLYDDGIRWLKQIIRAEQPSVRRTSERRTRSPESHQEKS